LKQLIVDEKRAEELREELPDLPVWDLTQRQSWDLDLLQNGAFSPLEGYLAKDDYDSVCEKMRLGDGTLWPMPIMLDVTVELAERLTAGGKVALRHPEGMVIAVLNIKDIWEPDLRKEAQGVFGTTDDKHPGVAYLFHSSNPVYVGGSIEGIEPVPYHTYRDLRYTPAELRAQFEKKGWQKVVAFQTRNPLHRAHVELTRRAIKKADANLLLHPVVGLTKPGDVDYFSRVRCYQAVIANYPERRSTMLSLLPLAMRMGGPKEALWHAIIRKNYGCSHFIVGRDHAGPGADSKGNPFYPPYGAQELMSEYEEELQIKMVDFEEMVYVEDLGNYMPRSEVAEDAKILSLSGTELRRRLREGLEIPEWFSYPQVIEELRRTHPPRDRQGVTIFLTGLPGTGKNTVASILTSKLLEYGNKQVTLLDRSAIRQYISNELGHSRTEADTVVRRLGFIAQEITKNRGIAICAYIAPSKSTRDEARELIAQNGSFIEVHLYAEEELRRSRDRHGTYAAIESGEIEEFAGVTDPYEPPENAELDIDTSKTTLEQTAQKIVLYLEHNGYIGNSSS